MNKSASLLYYFSVLMKIKYKMKHFIELWLSLMVYLEVIWYAYACLYFCYSKYSMQDINYRYFCASSIYGKTIEEYLFMFYMDYLQITYLFEI